MKLYTIQDYNKWLEFEETGILIANKAFIDEDFLSAYDWLVGKMNEKIPNPDNIEYPIWCWDANKRKPDLRQNSWGPRGCKMVLITFEAPEEDVLFTDFEYWHQVLNFGFIPANEQEEYEYCETDKDYSKEEIIKSWDNLFTLPLANEQGTIWQVNMNQVKKVRPFICK